MSQKHIDRTIDDKTSAESHDTVPQCVEDAFAYSVAAQLALLNHEDKALAIQMVLFEAQILQTSTVSDSPIIVNTPWLED